MHDKAQFIIIMKACKDLGIFVLKTYEKVLSRALSRFTFVMKNNICAKMPAQKSLKMKIKIQTQVKQAIVI